MVGLRKNFEGKHFHLNGWEMTLGKCWIFIDEKTSFIRKLFFRQLLLVLQTVSRRLTNEVSWLFLSQFWPLLKWASYFETARAVVKIGSGLKPNHQKQVEPCYAFSNSCRLGLPPPHSGHFFVETRNFQILLVFDDYS